MGVREYLKRTASPSRWRVSALLALGLHAGIFLAGSVAMGTQAQYGMAGAVAANGGDPKVQTPEEQTVDLEDDSPQEPSERDHKPKPIPTPEKKPGTGGSISAGARALPSYYRNPPPPYPEESRKLKQEGLVKLYVQVDSGGRVSSVVVAQSSGFPLLDEAARSTVKDWQFKPARMAGIAVPTSVNVPVLFQLKDADR